MKKLCLILSSQQDLWELTTSSPPKHTKMLTVTSETSKSEKSKFLINAWIFFKLACEDSPYWILFMNGIWLDLPLGNIMKIRKNDVNSDFCHNLVDLSQIVYKSSNIQTKIGFIYKHHIFINIVKFLWWTEIMKYCSYGVWQKCWIWLKFTLYAIVCSKLHP